MLRVDDTNPLGGNRFDSCTGAYGTFYFGTTRDVAYQQSQVLAAALTAAGASPELTILPGVTHGDAQCDGTLLAPTIARIGTVVG